MGTYLIDEEKINNCLGDGHCLQKRKHHDGYHRSICCVPIECINCKKQFPEFESKYSEFDLCSKCVYKINTCYQCQRPFPILRNKIDDYESDEDNICDKCDSFEYESCSD
jgi:hypothetical protein